MSSSARVVYYDHREGRSKVPALLRQLHVPCEVINSAVDYIIGRDCFVERKTIDDFISSIANRRLFKQIDLLAGSCYSPLVLLEGGGLYKQNRVSPSVIRGTLLWISVTKKVPVLRTCDENDTAAMLQLLFRRQSALGHAVPRVQHQTPTPWQRQVRMLTNIPGIGPVLAKDLLKTFGTVTNIAQSSDLELSGIPGLGKRKIQAIRQMLPRASSQV